MPEDFSPWVRRRVQLQRLESAERVSGWITQISGREMRVRLTTSLAGEPGDEFLAQAFGDESLIFRAILRLAFDNTTIFRITGPFQARPAKTSPRISTEDMTIELSFGDKAVVGGVVDYSEHGLGIICSEECEAESKGLCIIGTPDGPVEASVDVANCIQREDGLYRVGLKLAKLSRAGQARWMRQFLKKAA